MSDIRWFDDRHNVGVHTNDVCVEFLEKELGIHPEKMEERISLIFENGTQNEYKLYYYTPLMCAAIDGNLPATKYLLLLGADIEACDHVIEHFPESQFLSNFFVSLVPLLWWWRQEQVIVN